MLRLTFFVMILWVAALLAYAAAPHLSGPVIAYSMSGNVYLDDLAHRRTLALIDHPSLDTFPAWSPDGRTLAFISSRDPAADYSLFALSLQTGDVRQITQLDRYRPQPYDPVAAPRWSPTGEHIAVPIGTGITVVDVETGAVTLHREDFPMQHARWTPDGRELVFLETGQLRSTSGTLWVFYALDIHTRTVREWGRHDLGCDTMVKPIALSPTADSLAYLCGNDIYRYDLQERIVRLLVEDVSFPDGLDWSPDGRRLVFTEFFVRESNGMRAGIVTVDVSSGRRRYGLPHPADKPVWMPR